MGIRNGRFKPGQVRAELLGVLDRWGRLVESDLKRMMDITLALRVDADLRRQLEQENLIRVEQVGDELVFTITEDGRRWLHSYRQRRSAERPPRVRPRRRGRPPRQLTPPSPEPVPRLAAAETETVPGSER